MFGSSRLEMTDPFKGQQLPLKSNGKWLLVWSGASSVGNFGIQLGKLAGYSVVTTASKSNFDMLRSLGADDVFDYNDPDVASKIKKATGNAVEYCLDCVCTDDGQQAISEVLLPSGHMCTILPSHKDKFKGQKIRETIVYSGLDGKDFESPGWNIPAGPDDRGDMVEWMQATTALLEKGLLKPLPVQLEGGMEDVQNGFVKHKASSIYSCEMLR